METNTGISETDEDLHCEECGYNLRGLSRRRCPECGCTFDVDELRLGPDAAAHSWRATWSRAAPLTVLAMCGSFGMSAVIQAFGYSDRTGPGSREWIVHNLLAPWHYILATVVVPSTAFGVVVITLLGKVVQSTKRMGLSGSLVIVRITALSFLAFALLAFQFSCLHTCATIGD